MNTDQSLDPRVAAYLAEGPGGLPLDQRERIAMATAGLSQRRRRLDGVGAGGQRWVGALAGSALTLAAVLLVMANGLVPVRPGAAVSSASATAPVSGPAPLAPTRGADPSAVQLLPELVGLAPGRYAIQMYVRVELTVGAGWYVQDNGRTITRKPFLSIHALFPLEIATDVCDAGAERRPITAAGSFLAPADIAAAIESLTGIGRTGPMPARVGNLAAQKYVLTLAATCNRPEGRWVMGDDPDVGMAAGGTLTLYVMDVGGEPLVIAVSTRDATITQDELEGIDAVLASMYIWNDSPNWGDSP